MNTEIEMFFQFIGQLTIIMGLFMLADDAYQNFKSRRNRNAK